MTPAIFSTLTLLPACLHTGLIYRSSHLLHLAAKRPDDRTHVELDQLLHYLSVTPGLQDMPRETRLELSRALVPQRYTHGEVLLRQGRPAPCMFILVSGGVGVFQQGDPEQVAAANLLDEPPPSPPTTPLGRMTSQQRRHHRPGSPLLNGSPTRCGTSGAVLIG